MLTKTQLEQFNSDGFLFIPELFSEEETQIIQQAALALSKIESPKKILEKNGSMRSFFAPHEESELLDKVNRMNKLVLPAQELLNDQVYIHQTKINSKHALLGDWWDWHQDFPYWHIEDGMPQPKVLTAMIFLNDVNEFNGPMILVPGSQKAGLVDATANEDVFEEQNEWFNSYQASQTYMPNLTANLKYTLKQSTLASWIKKMGIYSAKGKAGGVLFFDGLVFHASSNNLSAWDRHTYLVTYNSVNNTLNNIEKPRPSFLASRDFSPVKGIDISLTAETVSESIN